jgi:probable rRNA maturation factor
MKRTPLKRIPPIIAVELSNTTRGSWVPGSRLLTRWAAAALRPRQPQVSQQQVRQRPVGQNRVGQRQVGQRQVGERQVGERQVGQRQVRQQILSVRVVGTTRSRSLNLRYRHKDKPTNVLSFAGAGDAPDGRFYLGELVICAPIVALEARRDAKSVRAHWAHLTIHGVLHLLGFDHESRADAARMSAREIQILDRLGFSDPYR